MTTPIAPKRDSFARRHWGKLTLAALLLAPVLVFAIWSAIALTYTYSEGQRVGFNQKLSRKGWICKTWEGELALSNVPGQAPELFQYSVRDDAVAEQIQRLEGARVALTYEQHKGLPTSCFGETEYFATGVARADEPLPGTTLPGTVPGTVPGVTPGATPGPATAPGGSTPAPVPGVSPAP